MTFSELWHRHKTLLIVYFVLIFLFLISFFLELSGSFYAEWNGCGVDANGRLYVGAKNKIVVYEGQQKVETIYMPAFRSYMFMIENGTIKVTNSHTIYTYDLQGNQLSQEEDYGGRLMRQLKTVKRIKGDDGNTYTVTSNGFGYSIYKYGITLMYKTPIIHGIITALFPVTIIVLLVLSFIIRRKLRV